MARLWECDWCHDLFEDRAQVASLDITVGQVNKTAHLCGECAPDWLTQHYPEEREVYAKEPATGDLVTDGGAVVAADATPERDLSRFQLEICYQLATAADYGLGLLDSLEDYYGEDIPHGRLYANLDTLVERGIVVKTAQDQRTNEHALTAAGRELVRRDAQRRYAIADGIGRGE